MVRVWDRDAALDPADLVDHQEEAPGLVFRDKDRDKDRDLPEAVRVDPAVFANSIALQCPSVRHPKRHG